jgi:hypothetical protein
MRNKATVGMRLHKQIALGTKPKDVVTSKGISSKTVNKLKK